jgi:cell division protein FtsA
MKERLIVAVDVGSSNVVIAVGAIEDDGRVNIQGIVSEPIEGIDAGHVENSETAGRAVKIAKERIEQELNIKITEAYAGLSGDFVRCVQVTDYVYVQDELGYGSNQITERDVAELDRRMRSVKLPDDREEIISMEAVRYTIDEKVVDVPVGAYGHVLKATYNFILCDRSMRERLNQCLMKQGIKVKDFAPNALISHLSVATDEDIEEGAIIIDLGGGVTDVSVLMHSKVRHIASIPIGADIINSDIRAYGIPANYIENLKRRYGCALTDKATDDKIVFPVRRGVPKSILRRNLATIIESRLKEIADWVRREIKEAGCGPQFSPILLITGGGAEMQDIESLFARELGIDEVRVVYPEYGFTDNMTDHITTSAYATVASLLLYGSMHGACSVAVGPNRDVNKPAEKTPIQPVEEKPIEAPKEREQRVEEKTEEEEAKPTRTPLITVDPTPSNKVQNDKIIDDDDIFGTGSDDDDKPKWWDKIKKKISTMGDSFAGKDEEDF